MKRPFAMIPDSTARTATSSAFLMASGDDLP